MNKRTVCGIMLTLLIVSTLALAFEVQPIRAEPTTIIVPDDHPTIQEAINNANEGDTIFVRAGTYYENLYIGTNNLTLIGEDRGTTVIDGGETRDDVVALGANNVTMSGFTLLNGRMDGIHISHGSFNTLYDNIITNMEFGISLYESHNNMIVSNTIADCLNGVVLDYSDVNTLLRNAISGNWHAGIALHGSDLNVIRENSVTYNGEEIPGGWNMFLYDWSANNLIFHNDFIHHACLDQVFIIDSAENSWDDGPSGGNYWGQPPFPDPPEPYVIDDLNRDNYPSARPLGPDPRLRTDPWSTIQPVGRPIIFDASGSWDIIEYYFDYGDGSVSGWITDSVQTHSYEQVGEYVAKVLVLDNYGRKAWDCRRMTIIPAAEPDFEIQVSPKNQIGQPPPPDQIDSSVHYEVKITSKNDFSSSVTFSVSFSPFPEHIGWNDPASVTPPPNGEATTTLEVNIYSDTPLRTFKITITATSQGITKSNTVRLSVERSLEVPYQHQGKTLWCGPASLAMVLRYNGEEFHSWDYARDENLPSWWMGAIDPPWPLRGLEDYVYEKYPSLTVEIRSYGADEFIRPKRDIESDIVEGYPVILNLGLIPGHMVVAVGFNETGLFLNDPSGALFTYFIGSEPLSSYNHAYADWVDVIYYLKPWPGSSTMTVKGAPHPEWRYGTTYITNRFLPDISFHQGDDPMLTKEHYALLLDMGLNWYHNDSGHLNLDPVIDKKCDSLYVHLIVSNCRRTSQSFTAFCRILAPNNVVYPLGAKETGGIPAFSQKDVGIYWQVSDLDDLLLKGGPYYLEFDLIDSNGFSVDHFKTMPFFWEKAQSIKLKEKQHHLYLHVYDAEGNHVGLNYATNEVDLGVPGSYYNDDQNGTIIIVLPQIIDLTIVVDAKCAEDPIESYDLTVVTRTDLGVFSETCSSNIIAGESHTFRTQVSEAGLELYLLVDIDIDPDTLNLKSNGEWITAYIELPGGYNLSHVDISTVQINNTISVDSSAPSHIGDHDLDGVPDLMVKFDRASIIEWLGATDYSEETGKSCLTTITIKGKVSGTAFEGSDTIKTLRK